MTTAASSGETSGETSSSSLNRLEDGFTGPGFCSDTEHRTFWAQTGPVQTLRAQFDAGRVYPGPGSPEPVLPSTGCF